MHISATGLCHDHSVMTMAANVRALRAKEGPEFERWLRATANGVVKAARRGGARARMDGGLAPE